MNFGVLAPFEEGLDLDIIARFVGHLVNDT